MTQVVEHLPSKHKAPKFNPQYHTKNSFKKKEKKLKSASLDTRCVQRCGLMNHIQ
jgi:hypothetical protein